METYLIWSHEHGMWWGPGHCGYVDTVDEAGRYDRNEAADIVLDHIPAGEEVAVTLDSALSHDRGAVFGVPEPEVTK